MQRILSGRPLTPLFSDPLSIGRLLPRADRGWAPPVALPAGCRQVYVAAGREAAGWGFTVIEGGDVGRDLSARVECDTAGRVDMSERTPLEAQLRAVGYALDLLAERRGGLEACPLVVRLTGGVGAVVAGVWDPPEARRIRQGLARQWGAERERRRDQLWLAGWDPVRTYAWGERATALAEHGGLEGFWGDLPTGYSGRGQTPCAARPVMGDGRLPRLLRGVQRRLAVP